MSEPLDLQVALKEAVKTEKDAMDYYKYGAEKMAEDRARKAFELLAREERQHAQMFYNVYRGGDLPPFDEYMESPPDTESPWWQALKKAMLAEFDEQRALELAIEQEEILAEQLLAMAARIDDPEIRAIYESNANSTQHHLELIEEEYKAMLGMSA